MATEIHEEDDFTLTCLNPQDRVTEIATAMCNHIQQTMRLPLEDFLTLHGLLQESLRRHFD